MRVAEAARYLDAIEYKPNHVLRMDVISDDLIKVWWEFERPDCYNPSAIGTGVSGPVFAYLPEVYTEEQLVRMVFGMTMRLEEHECREFFLYYGERPFDPHKELI